MAEYLNEEGLSRYTAGMKSLIKNAKGTAITEEAIDEMLDMPESDNGGGGSGSNTESENGGGSVAGGIGGYYTINVSQVDEDTVQVSYEASNEEMAAVEPQTVNLPTGPKGDAGTGITAITIEEV